MVESGKYRLRLLGPFGLFTPAGTRIEITSRKAVALIALLAAAPDGLRTRNWLQSMLWGAREAEQAQGSLRREISTLVATLKGAASDALLICERTRLRLALDLIAADIFDLPSADRSAGARPGGDYLEGLDLAGAEEFEEWLREQRERFAELQAVRIPMRREDGPSASEAYGAPLPAAADLIDGSRLGEAPKPSVAVLPFAVLSGGEGAGWIGTGIAEEVGMSLSRFPQLFVVATGSAAALADRGMTMTEIAARLGVRYLLAGAVRREANALKASLSLICGRSGAQVWTCAADGRMDDVLALQERLAALAAPQIWTKIDLAERRRILASGARNRSNYELYWRANALFRTFERDGVLEAIFLADELVRLDRNCAFAASLAAFCHGVAFASRWTTDPASTRRAAIAHCQNALRFGGDNVEALGYVAGALVSIGGDMELADRVIGRALTILPAHQPTLFWGGWVDISNGVPRRARERFELALRINPVSGSRPFAIAGLGVARLLERDYAGAVELLQQAVVEVPTYPPAQLALCAAAMKAERPDIAQEAARAVDRIGARSALGIFRAPDRKFIEAALDGFNALGAAYGAPVGASIAS